MTGQATTARRLGGWRRTGIGFGTFAVLFVVALGLAHVLSQAALANYLAGAMVFSLTLAVFLQLDRWRLDVPLAVLVAVGGAWPMSRPTVCFVLTIGIIGMAIYRSTRAGGAR